MNRKILFAVLFIVAAAAVNAETIITAGVPVRTFFVDYTNDYDDGDWQSDVLLLTGLGVRGRTASGMNKIGFFGSLWALVPVYSREFENESYSFNDFGLSVTLGMDYKLYEGEKSLFTIGSGLNFSIFRIGDNEINEEIESVGVVLAADYYLNIGKYYYLNFSFEGCINFAADYDYTYNNQTKQDDIDYRTALPSFSLTAAVTFGVLF